MAEDGEVIRQLWDSYLPVSFHLSPNDRVRLQTPEPYYSMVPRLSYFSIIIDKVVVYFSQFLDQTTQTTKTASNLWLDFLGTPLRLNYPIGLLYDLYAADIELPWSITVNFNNFPSDQLVRCNTRASLEPTYMSALKESDALKHRSPLVSTMQKKDHTQLWNGLVNYKFDQFWSINRRLMSPQVETPSTPSSAQAPAPEGEFDFQQQQQQQKSHEDTFRHIPFRLYLCTDAATTTSSSSSGAGGSGSGSLHTPLYIQRLIKPTLPDGRLAQFVHLLVQTLAKHRSFRLPPLPHPQPPPSPPTSSSSSSATAPTPTPTSNEEESNYYQKQRAYLEQKYRFITQGIEPPLDTPLQWMSEHLSYPDGFLHIVIFDKLNTTTAAA